MGTTVNLLTATASQTYYMTLKKYGRPAVLRTRYAATSIGKDITTRLREALPEQMPRLLNWLLKMVVTAADPRTPSSALADTDVRDLRYCIQTGYPSGMALSYARC